MGIIIAKFRKKKTTTEILDKLENEIKSIEEFRRSTEQTQKRIVGRFIVASFSIYLLAALIFYFYFFPAATSKRFIYIIPLIIIPFLLVFIKRVMTWYYNRKIRNNQVKLTTLKDEKKKILEEVMDKETYKVAKGILEKFAPEQVKKQTNDLTPRTPLTALTGSIVAPSGVRYRGNMGGTPTTSRPQGPPPQFMVQRPGITPSIQSFVAPNGNRPFASTPLPLTMARAILPKDRTAIDKMVDYLVGDGPSNRFALICKNCAGHNGMALKEEFDYLSFRCCYCSSFNPSRKQRPVAPKLEGAVHSPLMIKNKESEESESDSDWEEGGPIVTEPHGSDSERDREFDQESNTAKQETNVATGNAGNPFESDDKVEELNEVPHSNEAEEGSKMEVDTSETVNKIDDDIKCSEEISKD